MGEFDLAPAGSPPLPQAAATFDIRDLMTKRRAGPGSKALRPGSTRPAPKPAPVLRRGDLANATSRPTALPAACSSGRRRDFGRNGGLTGSDPGSSLHRRYKASVENENERMARAEKEQGCSVRGRCRSLIAVGCGDRRRRRSDHP